MPSMPEVCAETWVHQGNWRLHMLTKKDMHTQWEHSGCDTQGRSMGKCGPHRLTGVHGMLVFVVTSKMEPVVGASGLGLQVLEARDSSTAGISAMQFARAASAPCVKAAFRVCASTLAREWIITSPRSSRKQPSPRIALSLAAQLPWVPEPAR